MNYATPPTHRGRPVVGSFVALLAICASLFGLLMLSVGIPGLVEVCFHSEKADFAHDLFEVSMFLLIGVFCICVAIRWFRAFPGIIAGK